MTGANPTPLHAWLRRRILLQCVGRLAMALGMLALGVVVLYLTYWFVYGIWYFAFVRLGAPAHVAPFVSAGFLVLLFIGNARTDRQYLEELSVTTGTFSNEVVTFYLPGIGMASNINPIAPDSMHTSVKIITTLLFSGPRAIVAAYRCLRMALRLMRIKTEPVSAVIDFLYTRSSRVDFQTIVANVSDLNPVETFPQVTQIEGILLLRSEPAGLTISSELREEIDAAIKSN